MPVNNFGIRGNRATKIVWITANNLSTRYGDVRLPDTQDAADLGVEASHFREKFSFSDMLQSRTGLRTWLAYVFDVKTAGFVECAWISRPAPPFTNEIDRLIVSGPAVSTICCSIGKGG